MDYKPKYLKYKSKYLNLKKQMGGDIWVGKYKDNSIFEGKYYKDKDETNLNKENLGTPEEKFGWSKCEIVDIKNGYYYAKIPIVYGNNSITNIPFSIPKYTIVYVHNKNNSGAATSFDKYHIAILTINGYDINADNKVNINDLKKIENDENGKNIDILNNFFGDGIEKITYDGKEIVRSSIIYNSDNSYNLTYFFLSERNNKQNKYKNTTLTSKEMEKIKINPSS